MREWKFIMCRATANSVFPSRGKMMASERQMISEAYAGDIIGVFDPGIFSIGDTICMPGKKFRYEGIPTFAPEHFARVRQLDTMKRKQFIKGISEIAQEGAIQIFQEYNTGMEEIIVGVVGVLQFDVLKYRLENEYKVDIRLEELPYEYIRWIENEDIDLNRLVGTSDMKNASRILRAVRCCCSSTAGLSAWCLTATKVWCFPSLERTKTDEYLFANIHFSGIMGNNHKPYSGEQRRCSI